MLQSPQPVQQTEAKELPCLRCPCFKVKSGRAFHLSTRQFLQPWFSIYMVQHLHGELGASARPWKASRNRSPMSHTCIFRMPPKLL